MVSSGSFAPNLVGRSRNFSLAGHYQSSRIDISSCLNFARSHVSCNWLISVYGNGCTGELYSTPRDLPWSVLQYMRANVQIAAPSRATGRRVRSDAGDAQNLSELFE